jgi:ABC-2 type transport system ATP-binding protein
MNAVSIKNLTKTYNNGSVLAVDDVSFDVRAGELFGLIGPDGAGKTSIFRMLTTLLVPDKGLATVADFDVVTDYRQIRNCVGYMPGKFSLYQDLTVRENLEFFATVFGTTIEANYALIKDIYDQISPFNDRRAGKLSGGMKQKLALCCALIHKPKVLLLDEPTTGVDVVSRREFWAMLKRLKQQGITVLVSTPYMDEAILCERIALIQKGRIMSVDTPENILAAYPTRLYAIKAKDIYRLLTDVRSMPGVTSCYAFGEYLHVTLAEKALDGINTLRDFATRKGHDQVVAEVIKPGIEDSFIMLMNHDAQLDGPQPV